MSFHGNQPPSPFIREWLDRLQTVDGDASSILDLAAGSGRHGRLGLARASVTFVDIDLAGLQDLEGRAGAELLQADLESAGWPLGGRQFDIVIVANYLWRPNWQRILQLVRPGGHLIYETFATGNEAYGKPSNPNFLLCPGELLEVVRGGFDVLDYRHGREETPKPAVKQKIAARRLDEPAFSLAQDGYVVSDDPVRLDHDFTHRYLHDTAYWCRGLPRDLMEKSLRHSVVFGVYREADGVQVGFGRVITDRATFAYLGDVFMDEGARGKGLSKLLMQAVSGHPDLQGLRRFMLATADAHGLYRQFGFTALDNPAKFMEIARPGLYQR